MLTIDLKDLLICLLIIVAIVLVIYGIVAVSRLAKSMTKLDKILTDFEVVSDTASKRTKQLDGAIDNISKTVSGVSKKVKDGQNIIAVISILVQMFGSISQALKKDGKDGTAKKD
ncbi:MAG: hypothetical protein LBR00_01060 [Clostridiales Family XIII bacterium]|jgi:ABC-type transporter Mla subunit MlaD|nr:hypothetical protein [Clostridiales Family XIII bacterium]